MPERLEVKEWAASPPAGRISVIPGSFLQETREEGHVENILDFQEEIIHTTVRRGQNHLFVCDAYRNLAVFVVRIEALVCVAACSPSAAVSRGVLSVKGRHASD